MTNYIMNSPQVISEEASDETVVINLETGSYFNLGKSASMLWACFVQGVDSEALKSAIKPEPVCDSATISERVDAFIATLLAEQLIKEMSDQFKPLNDTLIVDITSLEIETFTDMQDLLGLDPIHEVEAEAGWPKQQETVKEAS